MQCEANTGGLDNRGPLAGVTVLDLSAYVAGPYGCTLLGDLGAEIIKIEPPRGDAIREYASTLERENRAYLGVNRNKLGVVLDLKRPQGVAALERLIRSADVLVHNFRPSVPARLGIDYERVRSLNPRVIYCALSGYGEAGPMREKAGYDQLLQAMTGINFYQGPSENEPETVYGSIVDYYAASMIAYGVAAALFRRERTGDGEHVRISLLSSALAMQSARMIWAEGEPRNINRDFRAGGVSAIHPTANGSIFLSATAPHFWAALCELIGLPAMATDVRFDTVKKRAERTDEIVVILRQALKRHTAEEWEEIFGERVPCAVVRPVQDMFDHPQVRAERLIATMPHPVLGSYRGVGSAIKFEKTPCPAAKAAPTKGQHSVEVLSRHGFSPDEIEVLRREGVIRQG